MMRGLTSQQVEQSRAQHGANTLTPPVHESMWKLFFEKFNDPVVRVLIMAAVLSFAISFVNGEYFETIGIFVAILLSTSIAFFFERDAAKKFDLLNQINEQTLYKVYRNGAMEQVGKCDLVVGDVLVLDTGEEIPSDAMLLEATALSVNESTLTGEPLMRKTTVEADFKTDATYPSNMILRGTTIVEGNCVAEIIRVGDATEFGKVAKLATEKSPEVTPLTRQLERLAKLIGVCGFTLAFVTFTMLTLKSVFWGELSTASLGQLGLLGAALIAVFVMLTKVWIPVVYDGMALFGRKREPSEKFEKSSWLFWIIQGLMLFVALALVGLIFGVKAFDAGAWISADAAKTVLDYFMICVTLIVVAVPEGLPMSVTLSLALSMRKMLKANNLVRKMHASETIGATTVICTDKTGTLTKNEMRVSEVVDYGADDMLKKAMAINSTANLDSRGKPLGNPTEGALLMWMAEQGENYSALREGVVQQMPFSSKLKMMATIAQVGSRRILFVKGAPEYVLERCEGLDRTAVDAQLLGFQQRAMRTLAFAFAEIGQNEDVESQLNGLTLQAVVAISDPVREDVPGAVAACMSAGIAIKIVTGDTPATAREIARQIGLWNVETDTEINSMTGPEWDALSDEEAYERAPLLKIMARARPQDKQRLVQLLQRRGEVVAVTGDGTNDAPALNFANVGLSMGSGTSVAKEASDITLLDDSFASIATAVMWGRSVYLNIQRFVLFQLTINLAALLIVFLGAMLGFELPLTVTQMLWVNLIMDTFAAAALASLPPDKRVMERAPRKSSDFIITPTMARRIVSTGLLFVVAMIGLLYYFKHIDGGVISASHQTLFFTIFVMLQFWNMFNAKAYNSARSALWAMGKAKAFVMVGLLIVAGQLLIVTFGGKVFHVVPLSLSEWLLAIGVTSVVLWVGELLRLRK